MARSKGRGVPFHATALAKGGTSDGEARPRARITARTITVVRPSTSTAQAGGHADADAEGGVKSPRPRKSQGESGKEGREKGGIQKESRAGRRRKKFKRKPQAVNDKVRCPWPGENPLYVAYHDLEWGVPEYDDRALLREARARRLPGRAFPWITILKKAREFPSCVRWFRSGEDRPLWPSATLRG